jgi:hypothetical protein
LEALTKAYEDAYPQAPALSLSSRTDHLYTLTSGDHTLAITLVPRPIPWDQLEGPCATAWYWPAAADTLRPHQAHLLVALVEEGSRSIDQATALTRLTSAVAQTTANCGIFWGPGRLVHPTEAFIAQAAQLAADDLPLFLWVDFRIERIADDAVRLYTTGVESLGGLELETPHFTGEPQALLEHAYNIAHYQLSQQKQIGQDDTIALADDLQVVAHREPSMLDPGLEVIRLEFA